ncbi:MAG: 30S ribosomal protein S20 [Spirochaetales bacterium]
MGKSSAQKRHEQSEKRRVRNRSVRSEVRTGIRKFKSAIAANDAEAAEQQLAKITKLIDAGAGKGVYHRNTAARTKSRLNRKLKTLR